MEPFTVSTTIAKPRELVFEYLADIANHPEFTDHYLVDWHMTRVETYGAGAGARFRIKAPLNRFAWADVSFAELQAPYRIVERGRGGKYNRIRMLGTYTLSPAPGNTTKVQYTLETLPAQISDRLMEILGGRSWNRRQAAKAMRRLRSILEENRGRGERGTIGAES
ncbi:MAG: SRPBCC family protein [Solirubrobacteraceae bacterium]